MQPGDVPATYADVEDLAREVDFKPATSIAEGIGRFVQWFKAYHRLRDMSMAGPFQGLGALGTQADTLLP
jgi:UDP-glucuronate 4-epimerase